MPVRKKNHKLVDETSEKGRRRICKLVEKSSREDTNPVEENTQSVVLHQKTPGIKIEKAFPRFGPAYGEDTKTILLAKNEALEHVLKSQNPREDKELMEYEINYILEIKKVEKEAWDAYDPDIVSNMKSSDFLNRMLKDCCFFLQLALFILGGSNQLGYHKQHMYFGSQTKNQESDTWTIRSMFFVGNQIPCVVIHQLMKQSFFRDVIRRKDDWNEPSDFPKRVLYELLVLPNQKRNEGDGHNSSSGLLSQHNVVDLLHGLECLMLGSQISWPIQYGKKDDEKELDDDDSDHYTDDSCDDDGNSNVNNGDDQDDQVDLEAGAEQVVEQKLKFPSATELIQLGIRLRKTKGGIGEISFRRKFSLFAYLYLPELTLDDNTVVLLQYLTNYETCQKLNSNKREISAYLRFMRDLTQTHTDVRILESKDILRVKRKEHKYKLPEILKSLGGAEDIRLTPNFHNLRIDITDYSTPPWHLLSLAAFFAIVQTVFTVLSYFAPLKS